MFLEELPFQKASICPNTTEFSVSGGIFGSDYIYLRIYDTEKSKEMDLTGFVYISEITRYYSNSFYLENGYLPIRTDNQNVAYLNQGGIHTMQGELTKREIKVYNSDVMDRS